MRSLVARSEHWPLSRPFRISRGAKDAADVVVVEARADGAIGVGECVPYKRYDETIASVLAELASVADAVALGMTRDELQSALPPGAARNAVDCALWDLEAKASGRSVADTLGVKQPSEMITAVTISLDAPDLMADAARAVAAAPLLKVKVDANDPVAAIEAVRFAAPNAQLIVDPNESWSVEQLSVLLPLLAEMQIALIEQPVPAGADNALEGMNPPVPLCADEGAHVRADLPRIARLYQAINVKLDKAGGLTEALALERDARAMGLKIMVGCMVCTSLAIAPALLLAQRADFVDLDGPWWLKRDRDSAMLFENGRLIPPASGWGHPNS